MVRSVLFVCLGNICRSPLAEGVFRAVADRRGLGDRFEVDSAGTGGWHAGEPPHRRSIAVAARHGIDISGQRARQLVAADHERFDLILGLDETNVADIRARAPSGGRAEVALYRAHAEGVAEGVPDPYYGTERDYEAVFEIVRRASQALIDRLTAKG